MKQRNDMKELIDRELSALRRRVTELEEAERGLLLTVDTLSNTERQYRELVNFATDVIYVTDIYGYFTFLNPAASLLTGYEIHELLGGHFSTLVRQDYRDSAMDFFSNQFKEKIPLTYIELPILTKAGEAVWLGINTQMTAEGGVIIGYQAIARDITGQKKMEEALRESERRFREMLENIHLIAIMLDAEGHLSFCNTYLLELTGWALEEVLGRNWFDTFIPPDTRENIRRIYLEMSHTGKLPSLHENDIITSRGLRRTISWNNTVVRDDSGKITGTTSIGVDITDQRMAEDMIQEQIQFQQILMEAIPSPVFYKDAEGAYIGCNRNFQEYIGKSRAEIIGKTVFDITPPELARTYHQKDQELIRNPGTQIYESVVKTADGSFHDVIFNKATFSKSDGALAGLIGVIQDISERKRMESQREAALEALRLSEEKFRLIYEESPIGLELYDREGRLTGINRACLDIFGIAGKEHAMGFSLFGDPNLPPDARGEILSGRIARYEVQFSFEAVSRGNLYPSRKSGLMYLDVLITPLDWMDGVARGGYLVQVQDISDRKMTEERLRHMSMHDSLTGLYNRAYFEQEMVRIEKGRFAAVGMIMCDLDGLKMVNDTLGHHRGDELIRLAADVISGVFRAGDVVARIGGDEFVVVLPECDERCVGNLGRRLEQAVERYNSGTPSLPLSVAVGTASMEGRSRTMQELLREADESMYNNKNSRRDEVRERLRSIIERMS